MWKIIVFLTFSLVFLTGNVTGHSYHLGACPKIEPMPDFDMTKMLGLWYVIQKTSTASSCVTYNFTRTSEPEEYKLEQVSQHFALGLTPLDHQYRYTGHLTVPDSAVPARMTVKFPLSVAGTASYTIFTTDYNTYAAIFTCQKLTFAHRQSTTILSRDKTLEKLYIDKIRSKMTSANIDPFELSIVSQKDCPKPSYQNGTNINIDDETFSTKSIAGVFRKAGEKIGDGVEYLAGGAKNVYEKMADKEQVTERSRVRLMKNPDAEWLP